MDVKYTGFSPNLPLSPQWIVTNKSRRLNEFFLTVKDSVTKLTKKQKKESYNKLIH